MSDAMAERFGMPALRAPISHDDTMAALRMLVGNLAAVPHMEETAKMCGRDVATYIAQLENRAQLTTGDVAEINRKLDELLRIAASAPDERQPGGEGAE